MGSRDRRVLGRGRLSGCAAGHQGLRCCAAHPLRPRMPCRNRGAPKSRSPLGKIVARALDWSGDSSVVATIAQVERGAQETPLSQEGHSRGGWSARSHQNPPAINTAPLSSQRARRLGFAPTRRYRPLSTSGVRVRKDALPGALRARRVTLIHKKPRANDQNLDERWSV